MELSFHGKMLVVIPEVQNYVKTYYVKYGDKQKTYISLDDLLNDDFFDKRTLREIIDDVRIE